MYSCEHQKQNLQRQIAQHQWQETVQSTFYGHSVRPKGSTSEEKARITWEPAMLASLGSGRCAVLRGQECFSDVAFPELYQAFYVRLDHLLVEWTQ